MGMDLTLGVNAIERIQGVPKLEHRINGTSELSDVELSRVDCIHVLQSISGEWNQIRYDFHYTPLNSLLPNSLSIIILVHTNCQFYSFCIPRKRDAWDTTLLWQTWETCNSICLCQSAQHFLCLGICLIWPERFSLWQIFSPGYSSSGRYYFYAQKRSLHHLHEPHMCEITILLFC